MVHNEIGFVPHNIPFSNQALFSNLSEKERYIKFQNEFNKVKAHIDQHRFEDYDITQNVILTLINAYSISKAE
jgi:hypothetical protein